MKRIMAALKGKLNESLMNNKVEKIDLAIKAAETNFDEQIINADIKIEEALTTAASSGSIETLIKKISDAIAERENAQAGKKRLEIIKKYLNEDVEVD